MEGRKENKYNLSGICPECGKLIKVELAIATELVETGKTTAKEAESNGLKDTAEGTGSDSGESDNVRPNPEESPTAGPNGPDKPADSGNSAGSKKTGGGKHK